MEQHTKALLKVMSPETVRELVKSELQTYDADKTGRTDYALGTSGFKWKKYIFFILNYFIVCLFR